MRKKKTKTQSSDIQRNKLIKNRKKWVLMKLLHKMTAFTIIEDL